jgi:hypothetical protein
MGASVVAVCVGERTGSVPAKRGTGSVCGVNAGRSKEVSSNNHGHSTESELAALAQSVL